LGFALDITLYVIALLLLDITIRIFPEINWLLHALLFSLMLLCFCRFLANKRCT